MKKIIPLLALLLLLTSCANKWTVDRSNMPDELRTQYEQSIQESEAALDANANDIEAFFNIAFAYEQLGDYRSAVDYYKKVLEQNPNEPITLNNLAAIYEDMEDYGQAAEYIKQLYVLQPDNIETIRDTVRILLEAGDPGHAEEALENFTLRGQEAAKTDSSLSSLASDLHQDIVDYQTAHPDQQ
jgi:tetratricopeptide (TPR) repeat protein